METGDSGTVDGTGVAVITGAGAGVAVGVGVGVGVAGLFTHPVASMKANSNTSARALIVFIKPCHYPRRR
jgi:hypothetical protein